MNRRSFLKAMGIMSTINLTQSCLFKEKKEFSQDHILTIGKEWLATNDEINTEEIRKKLFKGQNEPPPDFKETILKNLENDRINERFRFFKGWIFFQTELDLCALMYSAQ